MVNCYIDLVAEVWASYRKRQTTYCGYQFSVTRLPLFEGGSLRLPGQLTFIRLLLLSELREVFL